MVTRKMEEAPAGVLDLLSSIYQHGTFYDIVLFSDNLWGVFT